MNDKHELLLEVLTDTPMKQEEIRSQLAMRGYEVTTRNIRSLIKDINNEYIEGAIPYVVISNSQGTFKSECEKDIRKYNEHKYRHALSELYMSYNVNKRLANKDNITFDEYMKEVLGNGWT